MPGSVHYVDSVDRILNDKLGERLSVLDISNTAGKGAVNETPVFLKAYNSKLTKGGGVVHVPGVVGTGYKFDTPLELTSSGPIEFIGEGRASKIFRGASLAAGKGMFNLVGAKNITFRRLLFDGAVTTPVGLTYASFGSDPAHASLTTNSMFWLHGGEDITFIDCDFEHSGGYAAYLDARAAYVRRIKFINCRFRNNRPHLFGASGADMTYGSWTGGIFGQNQATGGSVFKVEDLQVTGCHFARNTGNCVWQHGYGFDSFHQRIHVDHNSFLDCGLDGVLFGNVTNGSCIGNSFRRIGYICTDDTSASVPKWLTNKNATALDTSGLVKLVPYQDNTFLSINGGAINGDGYCYGTISGNTIRVPNSSHPEYDEDHIGTTFGPGATGANWSQGIVLGNSADGEGGIGVTISGNLFDNLGGTAIGLYGARKCQAVGNLIIAPSTANQQPIMIGGFGTAPNQRATDNLVTENTIHYSPVGPNPAIFEDPTYRAFVPADVNRVVKNVILGNTNVFEFQKDPNSDSNTALHFTTSASVNYQHRHGIIREGKQSDSSSALRFYAQDGGAFGYLHMQLQMYRNPGVRGPLLNVAEFGPGITDQGGVITTGNVTTAPFGNTVITGKLAATGFLALTDSTFSPTEANLLDDNWALLRWENTANRWEQSITTSAGARVWTPFVAGTGAPSPPVTSVQFNNSGAFGGSANFTWNNASQLLVVTTFAYNGIQVVGGGFYGNSINLTKYAAFTYSASVLPDGGDDFTSKVMLYADTSGGHLRLVKGSSPTGYGDWSLQCSGIYATGNSYNSIQAPLGGVLVKGVSMTSHAIFAPIAAPFVLVGADFTNNALLFFDSGVDRLRLVKGTGVTVGTVADHDFQVRNQYINQYLAFKEIVTAPAVSALGEVRIYADTDHQLYISTNTAAYGPFGGTSPGGLDGAIQFNDGGVFGGEESYLYWDKTANQLYVTCAAGQAGISVSGGWVQSEGGFLAPATTATNFDAIQAPGGGVFAKSINATEYMAFTPWTPGSPVAGDSFTSKTILLTNPANNYLYVLFNDMATLGNVVAGIVLAATQVDTPRVNTSRTDDGYHWAASSSAPATAHAYGIRIDTGNFELIDLTWGSYSFAVFPAGSAATPSTQRFWVNGLVEGEYGLGMTEQATAPAVSVAGKVRIYAKTDHLLYISTNTGAYVPFGGSGSPGGSNTHVQFNSSGVFGGVSSFVWNGSINRLEIVGGASGGFQTEINGNNDHWVLYRTGAFIYQIGIDGLNQWYVRDTIHATIDLAITPGSGTATTIIVSTPGTYQSYYVNATGPAQNAIQAVGGGVLGKWCTCTESLILGRLASAPGLSSGSGAGEVRIYADTNGVTYISTAGAAWGPLSGTGIPGGLVDNVQFKNGLGAFDGSGDFTFNNSTNRVDLWGPFRLSVVSGHVWEMSAQSGSNQFWIEDKTNVNTCFQILPSVSAHLIIVYTSGYFESGYGFNSQNNQFNTFRCTGGGGAHMACLRADYYTHIGQAASAPGMMYLDGLSYGCMYYNTTSNTVMVYTNAGWKTVSVF